MFTQEPSFFDFVMNSVILCELNSLQLPITVVGHLAQLCYYLDSWCKDPSREEERPEHKIPRILNPVTITWYSFAYTIRGSQV